ncbi:MAG: NADH-quinone oxidoreductase subunit C [Defluviitaleaceae bacterium]|nr:NADH-quinone oxidoreductase subunit C [Defluviitaleaceae bacterium]
MKVTQEFTDIQQMDLLNKTLDMKNAGYRLAQICASRDTAGCFVLLYTFEKDGCLVSLRFINGGEPIESIGWLYGYAFLYENEMKDLFGMKVINMNMDFGGRFYQTAQPAPFTCGKNEGAEMDG